MLEPEKPGDGEPDPNNPKPLKDQKPAPGDGPRPDEDPSQPPAKE